jgi:hypothetical protein
MKPSRTLIQSCLLTAGMLVLGLMPGHLSACLMRSDVPSSAYEAHSDQYQGQVLWLGWSNTVTGQVGREGSAVRLNEQFALTAGHCVGYSGSMPYFTSTSDSNYVWMVGNGNNQLTNMGDVRFVTNVIIYPDYNGNAGFAETPDFAILKFDRPLAGNDLQIAQAYVGTGSSYTVGGEEITGVGFGNYETPAADAGEYVYDLLFDGKRRAWDMTASVFYGFYAPEYMEMNFSDQAAGNYSLNGASAPGDSGGPNFNSKGQLVSLVTGGPTYVDAVSETVSVQLASYADWIASNTVVTVPTLFAQGSSPNMVLTWGGNYTLQSSTNLTGGYADVSGATNPYTNTLTGDAQRFFRLYAVSNSSPSLLAPSIAQPQLKPHSLTPSSMLDTNVLNQLRLQEVGPM